MTKVFIYRNLHKKCWSVKDWKTKLVIAHLDELILSDCEFKVSEAGRQRVLKEKKKNVHAGVLGYITTDCINCFWQQVTYNPHRMESFRLIADNTPVYNSELVLFDKNGHVFLYEK